MKLGKVLNKKPELKSIVKGSDKIFVLKIDLEPVEAPPAAPKEKVPEEIVQPSKKELAPVVSQDEPSKNSRSGGQSEAAKKVRSFEKEEVAEKKGRTNSTGAPKGEKKPSIKKQDSQSGLKTGMDDSLAKKADIASAAEQQDEAADAAKKQPKKISNNESSTLPQSTNRAEDSPINEIGIRT